MQNAFTPDYRVLLPGENPREYREHLNGLLSSIGPRDYDERLAVEEFAAACWVWRRARAVETQFLFQVGSSYNRGPDGIAEALFYVPDKHFRNFHRYMTDAERRYQHARRAVDRIKRDRDNRDGAEVGRAAAAGVPEAEAVVALPAEIASDVQDELDSASAPARGQAEHGKRNEANPAAPLPRPPATKRSQSAARSFSLQARGGPADNVDRSA